MHLTIALLLAAGWATHNDDAAGFTVDHPQAWIVQENQGRVDLRGPADELVVIWPFFVNRQGVDAGSMTAALAARVMPEARFEAPMALDGGAFRVVGAAGDTSVMAFGALQPAAGGTSGHFVLFAAPKRDFDAGLQTFDRIVQSFRARGPATAQPLQFRTWHDPREAAFTVEIPHDWTGSGGTYRERGVLVQAEVSATSPDGRSFIHMGDRFDACLELNGVLAAQGYREGDSIRDQVNGTAWPICNRRTAAQYIEQFLLPGMFRGARVTRMEERPDLVRTLERLVGMGQYTAAEAEFTFQVDGRPFEGAVICTIEALGGNLGGYWHPWRVWISAAPQGEGLRAEAALLRLSESFAVDQTWASQNRMDVAVISRATAEMSDSVRETWREAVDYANASGDEVSRRRSEAIRGVTTVTDPATGQEYEVDNTHSYYWMDSNGNVTGSDSSAPPSGGGTLLEPRGR